LGKIVSLLVVARSEDARAGTREEENDGCNARFTELDDVVRTGRGIVVGVSSKESSQVAAAAATITAARGGRRVICAVAKGEEGGTDPGDASDGAQYALDGVAVSGQARREGERGRKEEKPGAAAGRAEEAKVVEDLGREGHLCEDEEDTK
jgi:hypothetical protein